MIIQHMNESEGSPNNDEHDVTKVYGGTATASREDNALLFLFRVLQIQLRLLCSVGLSSRRPGF